MEITKKSLLIVVTVISVTLLLVIEVWLVRTNTGQFEERVEKTKPKHVAPIAYVQVIAKNRTVLDNDRKREMSFPHDDVLDLCKDEELPCVFNTSKWKVECPPYFIDINNYDLSNFTFITGASSDHFQESKDLIASIQKHFPHKKIYYYDLGLNTDQILQMRSWCNVVHTKWNARIYPKHVWYIPYYAFKSLVIHEAIMRFDAVLWLDASIRLSPKANHSNWQAVYDAARRTGGFVMFRGSERDTFQCTAKGMYKYLPADQEKLKKFQMLGSGSELIYRTKSVFTQIMSCWRLCGLTKECNEPKGHRKGCGRPKPGVSICHRYDQSSLNILAAKFLNYERKDVPKGKPVIIVHRQPTHFYTLMTNCSVKT